MKKFKLNALEVASLSNKKMMHVCGGIGTLRTCGCGCLYENQPGGSNTGDNRDANVWVGDDGAFSPGPIKEIRRVEVLDPISKD